MTGMEELVCLWLQLSPKYCDKLFAVLGNVKFFARHGSIIPEKEQEKSRRNNRDGKTRPATCESPSFENSRTLLTVGAPSER